MMKNSYMSVCNKGKSDLAGIVDSKKMIQNLSSLQTYINYTWFLTFTYNKSEHSEIFHLYK